jgi:hypothetical protein
MSTNILAMTGETRDTHLIGEGIAVGNGKVVVHAGSVNHDDHVTTGFTVDTKQIDQFIIDDTRPPPRVEQDARIMLFIGIKRGMESPYDVQVCVSFTQLLLLVIMKR